jgi:hypothetical protein
LRDDRVRLQLFTPKPGVPLEEPRGRLTDHAPWYGGDWLHPRAITAIYNNAICTSGFNWVDWASGGYRGSTANHCYQGTDIWYHNKQVYGVIAKTSPASDTMLIKDNSNPYAYYAAVWVGSVDTSDSRAVRGIRTTYAKGQQVALSGARTGLHTARITHPDVILSGIHTVITDGSFAVAGDSGGPWLTTMSANSSYPGDVVAWGQMKSHSNTPGYEGDTFVGLNEISRLLSASICIAASAGTITCKPI